MNSSNEASVASVAELVELRDARLLPDWLVDGADLMGRPDPGPTPWLIVGLIVDLAITAIGSRWKVSKSWAMLEAAISIATGKPAFGTFAVPNPGPVVYVIEESGEAALQRRLLALCRGRDIAPDELRGKLLLAANKGVKLDSANWPPRLLDIGQKIKPRAFIFDPLARMKASTRKENDQGEMAPLIEFLRVLREETNAASMFVAHQGHTGDHMRGTSDLESVWESRLMFKKDGESGLITIETEHREAGDQDSATVAYMLDWNPERRSMRLRSTQLPTEQKCLDWLADNAPATTDEVASGVNIRRTDVARSLANLERAGTACRQPVPRTDAAGRTRNVKCWMTSSQAVFDVETSRPDPGRPGTDNPETTTQAANRPAPLGADEDGVSFRASQTPPEIASDLSEEL